MTNNYNFEKFCMLSIFVYIEYFVYLKKFPQFQKKFKIFKKISVKTGFTIIINNDI